jgi:predicted MFS family arabinose efflux permease
MPAADRGYLALLKISGAKPLILWVSLARLVYGSLPLALLLLLANRRHSFTDAGVILAGNGIAAGLLGPYRSRLVDRWGTGRTLPAMAGLLLLATGALALAPGLPLPALLALAVLAGAVAPPVGPLMRAAWRRMTAAQPDRLPRAYSLDAALEESLYVIGPPLAAGLVAAVGAGPVVLGAVAVMLVAVLGIASRPLSGGGPAAPGSGRRLLTGQFIVGLAPVAGLAFPLGAVEVAAVAVAVAGRHGSLAGTPAAAMAVGSILGGLLYGRRRWPGRPSGQLRALAGASAALVALAALATALFPVMVGVLGVAGLCTAPAIVCGYLIADAAAPAPGSEATAWVNAAFNLSLAGGTATAGVLVDAASARTALLAAAAVTVIVVLLPALVRPQLTGQSTGD